MKTTLARYRKLSNSLLSKQSYAKQQILAEQDALEAARKEHADIIEAQQIIQHVAQAIQQEAHHRIAAVVSKCLISVFGDDAYEFKIDFERKRGRTEARMVFVRDGVEIDPLTAAGGGTVDIATFALRVACVVLSRPAVRRLIVMDEPFSHCKPPEVLGPKICEMLTILAEELEIQFVLIPSIEQHFQVGKIIEVG